MPKRRYQEDSYRKENGHYYSFFYRDRKAPDGSTRSSIARIDLGDAGKVSELSGRAGSMTVCGSRSIPNEDQFQQHRRVKPSKTWRFNI